MEATLTKKNLLLEGANSFLHEKPMLRWIQILLPGTVPIQHTVYGYVAMVFSHYIYK